MNNQMIYTFGYQKRRPAELLAEAKRLGAVVVDVRLVPRSRAPGWSKRALAELLGERYQHVRGFGNVNYKDGGPVELADAEAGLDAVRPILERGQSIILLCYEEQPGDCHRSAVARLLAGETSIPIEHLLRGEG